MIQDSSATGRVSPLLSCASALGLALTLAGLWGCSSAPSATVPPPAPPAPPPIEQYLATLTLDADSALLYAEQSTSSPVLATLTAGEQLSLIQRATEWLQVRTMSGVRGFIQSAALVAPTCTADRATPRILEIPVFAFDNDGPHGNVVIEAELDANARILNTRVLANELGDPAFEREALADLQRIRFLPPTKGCTPQRFFYTFTRQF